MIGGKFTVIVTPDFGTRIEATVPLSELAI
jgi:signal transduction histidine kinase